MVVQNFDPGANLTQRMFQEGGPDTVLFTASTVIWPQPLLIYSIRPILDLINSTFLTIAARPVYRFRFKASITDSSVVVLSIICDPCKSRMACM